MRLADRTSPRAKKNRPASDSAARCPYLGNARAAWNLEPLDLFLDVVYEVRRTGAVHDAMIEGQREGDHFRGFALRAVRDHLVMRGADEERPD